MFAPRTRSRPNPTPGRRGSRRRSPGPSISTRDGGTSAFRIPSSTNPKERRAGEPQRPVVRGIRQAGAVGELYRTPRRDLRKVSAVGERTYGSAPLVAGADFSSFQVEDLYAGWRSGTTLESLGENAVEFIVGRAQYQLGNGLLLADGSAEGGSRGGYWRTRARRSSLRRSAASRPALTPRRSSTWTRTTCPRATRAAGSGARITSSVSARTPRLVRPT